MLWQWNFSTYSWELFQQHHDIHFTYPYCQSYLASRTGCSPLVIHASVSQSSSTIQSPKPSTPILNTSNNLAMQSPDRRMARSRKNKSKLEQCRLASKLCTFNQLNSCHASLKRNWYITNRCVMNKEAFQSNIK